MSLLALSATPAGAIIQFVVALVFGVLATLLAQQFLNRRASFRYTVAHTQLGVTTDDDVYGSVRVTWNENPVKNLFLSTLTLTNESTKDFEGVTVTAWTDDTMLLTHRAEITNTKQELDYTERYRKKLTPSVGKEPSDEQHRLFSTKREFYVLTMNRNQSITFQFLNTADWGVTPHIWLDIVHPGVKPKFKPTIQPPSKIFDVALPQAAGVGIVVAVIGATLAVTLFDSVVVVACISLAVGLMAQLLGAVIVRAFRWLREIWAG